MALIGDWAGGGAVLADRPAEVAEVADDPFATLDRTATGTWIGWLGYQLGQRLERLAAHAERPVPRPAAMLARFGSICRCDGQGRWWVESVDQADADTVQRWQDRIDRTAPALTWSAGPLTARPGRGAHIGAVEETVLRIAAGQLYQANVCLRLEADFTGSALGLWCAAGARLRPARAGFVGTAEGAVASLSPEVFLLRHGRQVRSEPIKGTRPLTDDGRAELMGAAKDRAEHVMIVDLVRNDLGRVCVPGSVRVSRLAAPEPLAGVWHLVSTVEGALADGRTDAEVVKACFPPGSVTGAPKVAAELLGQRIEPTAREAYCGALGFASPDHGLELNVAIRTFEVAGGRLWFGVGGGVVAGSDGAAEWAECQAKAAPVLAAAGLPPWEEAAQPGGAPGKVEWTAGPCFDTALVVDGVVIEGAAHLERFRRATGLVGGPVAEAAVAGAGLGTWRLRVDEVGGVAAATMTPAAWSAVLVGGWSEAEVAIVRRSGGLGDRKWQDRAAIEALERRHAPRVPLLCDDDGLLLEATWANVFVVVDGVLHTPALDGRILPGVTRRVLLDEAVDLGVPLRIGPLPAALLAEADAVLLTSAVRGLVWVRAVQGVRSFAAPHELVASLAGALGRRWSAQVAAGHDAVRPKML